MFCSKCGTKIDDEGAAFCFKCGFQLGSSGKGGQSNSARNERRKPRTASEKSFYEVLEIPRDAEQSVIQEAIKKQRTLWSTRVARGGSMGEHARQIVNIIGEAEKTLLDAAKREEYDKSLIDVPDYYEEMPASERNWLETLYAFYDQGDWEVAEKAIDRAKSKHKDDSEFWFLAAQVYLKVENYQKAGDAAQQVLLLDPENPSAYGIRGDVYSLCGKDAKAIGMYEKMKSLAKDSVTRKVAEENLILLCVDAEIRDCVKDVSSLIPESFQYDKGMMDRLKKAFSLAESCKARILALFQEAENPSEWFETEKKEALQDIGSLKEEIQRLIDEGNEPVRLPGFWILIVLCGFGMFAITASAGELVAAGRGIEALGALFVGAISVCPLLGFALVFLRKPRWRASSSLVVVTLRAIAKYM